MLKNLLSCIAALIVILVVCSTPLAQAESDQNPDACDKYKKVDADLNRVYQRILADYNKNAVFIQKLRAAQIAWITFRDAQAEARFPAANKQASYGSVYPVCRCLELIRLTQNRIAELQMWVDGVVEGNVCAGSVKIN